MSGARFSSEGFPMPAKKQLKQYTLDARKVKRLQKFFKTETAEEAITQAIDVMLDNEKLERAHKRFVMSKGELIDVYGRLDPQ
jgi:hypothetical protein